MSRIRVTMGLLRGQWIETRPGLPYRPLPARLREAFFSHVGSDIGDRRFLDGFAGTGLVGLGAWLWGLPGPWVPWMVVAVAVANFLESLLGHTLRPRGLATADELNAVLVVLAAVLAMGAVRS